MNILLYFAIFSLYTSPATSHIINNELVYNDDINTGLSLRFQKTSTKEIEEHQKSNDIPVTIEMLLVCDKEFGDIFHHDRRKIIDYFTVYFWDVSMRFRTLPSVNISLVVNQLIVINSTREQPFILYSRDPNDGRADLNGILHRFAGWVYEKIETNLISNNFDIAIVITNTKLKSGGGRAYLGGACGKNHNLRRIWGVMVWNDRGDWGSVTVGAHEIAHSLGALHDNVDDDDKNSPERCGHKGYIMSKASDDLRWYFSNCTDQYISKFVRSDKAACLRHQSDKIGTVSVIGPDFGDVVAPTMQEQCRRYLNNSKAYIRNEDTGNCKVMKCLEKSVRKGVWLIWSLTPVDNSPCLGGGRCLRGKCIN